MSNKHLDAIRKHADELAGLVARELTTDHADEHYNPLIEHAEALAAYADRLRTYALTLEEEVMFMRGWDNALLKSSAFHRKQCGEAVERLRDKHGVADLLAGDSPDDTEVTA